jgi:hypothetical protein
MLYNLIRQRPIVWDSSMTRFGITTYFLPCRTNAHLLTRNERRFEIVYAKVTLQAPRQVLLGPA